MNFRKALAILLLPVLLFAYTNCGKFETASDLASSLSSACIAKIRRAPATVAYAASACENTEDYACEQREFHPGLSAPPKLERVCDVLDRKDSCVSVTTLSFDTESARDGSAPGSFDPGGEYNRTEVQCLHRRLQQNKVSLIAAEASTLREALSSAVQHCREKTSL